MNRISLKRRALLGLTGALGIASALPGCITRSLFEEHRYSESISSILISEDGSKLVVVGDSHHYIFDAPEILVKSLKSDFHRSVAATIQAFSVDGTGKTRGKVMLTIGVKAAEQDKLAALEAGYRKFTYSDQRYACEYEVDLVGMRYRSNGIQPSLASQRLNKTYTVSVVAEQSSGEKAARALLTPVTVAADGVLLIGAIPLLLLGFAAISTFVGVECKGNRDCFK